MAADLHIHIFEGLIEKDLEAFFSNTIGSKWFNPRTSERRSDRTYSKISDTPSIWVGEVSWLKAALFDDAKTFVPSAVQKVSRIIGENLPIIDDALIGAIADAMQGPNETSYELADPDEVVKFLKKHKGQRCFKVSW